jgi:hypothetical protein
MLGHDLPAHLRNFVEKWIPRPLAGAGVMLPGAFDVLANRLQRTPEIIVKFQSSPIVGRSIAEMLVLPHEWLTTAVPFVLGFCSAYRLSSWR